MKREFQIVGIFLLSFFVAAPFAYSQNQTRMGTDSTYSDMNSDTSEYHSKEYYNYAKKNIIEDKSPEKDFKGKWTDSSKTTTDTENDEWNKSRKDSSMNNNSMNKMNKEKDNMMNKKNKEMNKMKDSTNNKMNNMKNDTKENMKNMNPDTTDNY